MMSRKNYIAVANIISSHREAGAFAEPSDVDFMVSDFCTYFKMDNPNFSSSKFRDACYKPSNEMLGRVNAQESDYV
jgi:hypothetical protein